MTYDIVIETNGLENVVHTENRIVQIHSIHNDRVRREVQGAKENNNFSVNLHWMERESNDFERFNFLCVNVGSGECVFIV